MSRVHACPFCQTMSVRILDHYELNAIAAEEFAGDVAAYQCKNAHVFFVSLQRREPIPDKPRSMTKAAGSGK